jgi:hypothetical protein
MPETPVLMIEVASIVAGFLEDEDIKKLMRTCKQIHFDKSIKKLLFPRLHPATDASDYIKNMIGIQSTRVYRVYSEDRSANMYLGPPKSGLMNVAFFSIHFQDVLYTFNMPEGCDATSLDAVTGLFFRELHVEQGGMRIVLVVNSTLVLRAQSSKSYAVPCVP